MLDEKSLAIKRQIVEKGVKQILEEAKVPLQYHLKIIKKLHKALVDNTKQNTKHEKKVEEHTKTVAALHEHYGNQINQLSDKLAKTEEDHATQISQYQEELARQREFTQGEPGEDGQDAPPIDEEALVSRVLSKVPAPEKGDPGPKGETLEMDKILETVIKRIQKGDVIHINNVKGAGGFIKDGIKYRFDELMHGGGTSTSTGGITIIAVTGTINDSNMTFTAATQPTLLNINGAFYQKTGGAYTWTYVGTTITLNQPVGLGGSIFGI